MSFSRVSPWLTQCQEHSMCSVNISELKVSTFLFSPNSIMVYNLRYNLHVSYGIITGIWG